MAADTTRKKPPGRFRTVAFVAAVAVVCALILSLTASALRPRIEANQRLDVVANILASLGVFGDQLPPADAANSGEIEAFYNDRLTKRLVSPAGAVVDSDRDPLQVKPWNERKVKPRDELLLPVYVLTAADSDEVVAYSLPIWGKGLWGAIYGYLALEADAETVRGITFLSNHKETPGLGARIEEAAFREQWEGKRIFGADGALTPIRVVKGEAPAQGPKADHQVDGISGATMTCKGVNAMVRDCLELYEPYLRRQREGD